MQGKQKMLQTIKYTADLAAGATAFATVAGWLPPLAALCSIIWFCLQMYGWYSKRQKSNKCPICNSYHGHKCSSK